MPIAYTYRAPRRDDTGAAFLLYILVAIAIMGVVWAMAMNSAAGALQKNRDLAVQQDLRNYAKAAEAYFVRQSTYPTIPTGWHMRGRDPASENGVYEVWVHPSGPAAGYVILGRDHPSEGWTYLLSSYLDGDPVPADTDPQLPEGAGTREVLTW